MQDRLSPVVVATTSTLNGVVMFWFPPFNWRCYGDRTRHAQGGRRTTRDEEAASRSGQAALRQGECAPTRAHPDCGPPVKIRGDGTATDGNGCRGHWARLASLAACSFGASQRPGRGAFFCQKLLPHQCDSGPPRATSIAW